MSDTTLDISATTATPTILREIPLNQITKSEASLRSVNKQSISYLNLVASIALNGVLNSITVRELTPAEDGTPRYGLIDGLQRLTASGDAGKKTIPALVRNMNDASILEAQIIANMHTIETKPAEYTQQLVRILSANPTMTVNDLAQKLSVQEAWLNQRLSLDKLKPELQKLVDDGKLGLANAYILAKLPEDEQTNFSDRAQTENTGVFVAAVKARIKELREAKNQGKAAGPATFVPVPHLQKMSDIKDAQTDDALADHICRAEGATTNVDGFKAALAYVLNMDSGSVAKQKAKDEERKAKLAVEKEKVKAEREAKKTQEAAANAASITNL